MYYVGIDVSMKESALCILDDKGKIVRETKLPTDPEIIGRFIADTGLAIERIGLESGCTAAWLFAGLQRYAWPVICIDARHAAAAKNSWCSMACSRMAQRLPGRYLCPQSADFAAHT